MIKKKHHRRACHTAMLFSQWLSSTAVVVSFLISFFDNIRAFDNLWTKMKIQCNPSINIADTIAFVIYLLGLAHPSSFVDGQHFFAIACPIAPRTRAVPHWHFKCAIFAPFAPSRRQTARIYCPHLSFE